MYLEVNEENIKNLVEIRQKDMDTIDKHAYVEKGELMFIVPETDAEKKRFIDDWTPLCLELTEKRLKKFKRALKVRSFFKGYGIGESEILHMVMRFVAAIKIEQMDAHMNLVNRADKKFGTSGHGFTYIGEVKLLMEAVLQNTNDTPKEKAIVSAYDDLILKY